MWPKVVEGITNPDIIQAWPLIVLIGLCILNLDDKELAELRASNQRVKAMFEANAPRYKYGGSGDLLNQSEEPKKGTQGVNVI